ncbi:hypothetical protein [Cryobacterium melibiosiphilum]|uniref:hypothetical protein n=1 Tax=Cryobacterium melibiosiphilum TaxID=995039 RepID=UPI0013149FD1|nr:hypothetical protein [Cryobacterium melibiosiphilum]
MMNVFSAAKNLGTSHTMNRSVFIQGLRRSDAVLCLLIGLGSSIFVDVGGRVSVSEIVCLVWFIISFAQRDYWPESVRNFSGAAGILIVGLGLATLHASGPARSFLLAAANYTFLLILVLVLARILGRRPGLGLLSPLLVGAALSQIAGYILTPSVSALIDPWKFGLGWAVTILVMLAAQRLRGKAFGFFTAPALLLALAMVHLLLGSRSAAVIVLLCAMLLFKRQGASRGAMLGVVSLLIAGLAIASFGYEYLAVNGLLGEASAGKLSDQSGDFGLLFGARKELVLLFASWVASPVFGWGPDAVVPDGVRSGAYAWFIDQGYVINFADYDRLFLSAEVPLHSVVLGSLVQAGVFAIIFGFIAIRLSAISIRFSIRTQSYPALFICLTGVIHLLTSPLGDSTRFPVALTLAIAIYSVGESLRQLAPDSKHDHRLLANPRREIVRHVK